MATKKAKEQVGSVAQELLDEIKSDSIKASRDKVKSVIKKINKDINDRQSWIKERTRQIDELLVIQEDVLALFEAGEFDEKALARTAEAHRKITEDRTSSPTRKPYLSGAIRQGSDFNFDDEE